MTNQGLITGVQCIEVEDFVLETLFFGDNLSHDQPSRGTSEINSP